MVYEFFILILAFRLSYLLWGTFLFRKTYKKLDYFIYEQNISLIIPAFNEEVTIENTLCSVLNTTYIKSTDSEVIVIDDGSNDKTKEIVRAYAEVFPKLWLFSIENSGKASALNRGMELAEHEIVVCVDADTRLTNDTLENGVRHFKNLDVGAVSGVVYPSRIKSFLERFQFLEYTFGQAIEKQFQSIFNCLLVIPGAIGFFRKSSVIELGGYKKDTLTEDFDLTLELQKYGATVILEPNSITYTEVPNNVKDLIKQRKRWMSGTLQTLQKHWNMYKYNKSLGLIGLPYSFVFGILLALFFPIIILSIFMLPIYNILFIFVAEILLHQIAHVKYNNNILLTPLYFALYPLFNFYIVLISIFTFRKNKSWGKLLRTGV